MDETKELRAVMDISLTPLLVVDDDRHYVSANEAAATLFGATLPDLLTRRIDDFVPREWLSALEQLWTRLVESGRSEGKGDVVRPDGTTVTVEYRAMLNFHPGRHLFALRDVDDGSAGPVAGSRARRTTRPAVNRTLTTRQRQILQLAAGGCSTAEIADILFLSPGTVKTHFEHIYKKLSVGDRASAVALALRQGMID